LFGVELPAVGLRRARPILRRSRPSLGRRPLTLSLYRASLNNWWFDDLNDLLFVRLGGIVGRVAPDRSTSE